MITLNEYLSSKVKFGKRDKIIATNDNIKSIVENEIKKYGWGADLNHIDTSRCTWMLDLFDAMGENNDDTFHGDVSEWDVSNVTNMECMFRMCNDFNCDLSNWDVSKCENFDHMFCECTNFTGKGLDSWKLDNAINVGGMFVRCYKLDVDLSSWDLRNVRYNAEMFLDVDIDKAHMPKNMPN